MSEVEFGDSPWTLARSEAEKFALTELSKDFPGIGPRESEIGGTKVNLDGVLDQGDHVYSLRSGRDCLQ
jgi:hypothetical protein